MSSRLKECRFFGTLQILSSVTGILSRKGRSINNLTCKLNSLGEDEKIYNVIQMAGTKMQVCLVFNKMSPLLHNFSPL